MPHTMEDADSIVPSLLPVDSKILLNRKEAAGLLSISERTLSTLVAAGEIPVVRIYTRVLFRRVGLEEWAQRQEKCEPPDGPRSDAR